MPGQGLIKKTACVCLMLVTASMAAAQSAEEILERASKALIEAKTLRAQLNIRGEGADIFKSTMPVGQAALLMKFDPTEDPEAKITPSWTSRITGQTTSGSAQEKEPIKIDLVLNNDNARWLDVAEKKVYQYPSSRALATRSRGYSAARSLVLEELLKPVPLKDEIAASELELLDQVTIDGVKCDVIKVTYAKPEGRPTRGRPHQVARVSVGHEDHLIRRIERVSGDGAFSMTIVLELTKLEPGIELEDKQFDLPLPEGYTLAQSAIRRSTVVADATNATRIDTPPIAAPAEIRPAAPANVYPPSPDFSTANDAGETISLESLRGNVAVLYFWGSWSMECRPYSPLMSSLAENYFDRGVRVIGMAVRERDATTAVDVARVRDYTFEIAPNSNSVADAFSVVVFPTVAVIDAAGNLVGTERVRRGAEPDDVMNRVRTLVDKALANDGSPTALDDDDDS